MSPVLVSYGPWAVSWSPSLPTLPTGTMCWSHWAPGGQLLSLCFSCLSFCLVIQVMFTEHTWVSALLDVGDPL